jgi:hypothetical protein
MSERVEFEAWANMASWWDKDFRRLVSLADGRVDLQNEDGAKRLAEIYPVKPVRVRVTVEIIEPATEKGSGDE